ncbi:hypothetical protein A5684_02555 [Mycobacterium intracellulare]|nr:hypothetical protein A5684_02555 [Mycobacterium intracellulare]
MCQPGVITAAPEIDEIAPPEGRLERLRGRLARSQSAFGRSMLGLIGGGDLDEDAWQDVEDTLLVADLGPVVAESVIAQLRARLAGSDVRGFRVRGFRVREARPGPAAASRSPVREGRRRRWCAAARRAGWRRRRPPRAARWCPAARAAPRSVSG